MDRAFLLAILLQPVASLVVEDVDLEFVPRVIERQSADDGPFQDVERLVVGRDEDVDRRQLRLRAREESPLQPARLGAPIDRTAHHHEEEQDIGEGAELHAEDRPGPDEGEAAVDGMRQHGVKEAPEEIPHGHRENEGAGDAPGPGLFPGPVRHEDVEKSSDEAGRSEGSEVQL